MEYPGTKWCYVSIAVVIALIATRDPMCLLAFAVPGVVDVMGEGY